MAAGLYNKPIDDSSRHIEQAMLMYSTWYYIV